MNVALICMQPVVLHPDNLGNTITSEHQCADSSKAGRVLTIAFGNFHRLAKCADFGSAQASSAGLARDLAHARGRVVLDQIITHRMGQKAVQRGNRSTSHARAAR